MRCQDEGSTKVWRALLGQSSASPAVARFRNGRVESSVPDELLWSREAKGIPYPCDEFAGDNNADADESLEGFHSGVGAPALPDGGLGLLYLVINGIDDAQACLNNPLHLREEWQGHDPYPGSPGRDMGMFGAEACLLADGMEPLEVLCPFVDEAPSEAGRFSQLLYFGRSEPAFREHGLCEKIRKPLRIDLVRLRRTDTAPKRLHESGLAMCGTWPQASKTSATQDQPLHASGCVRNCVQKQKGPW